MKESSVSSYPLLDFKGKSNAVDELVNIIHKKQKITGEALIDSSIEELVSVGIPLGVAKMVLRRIPKE